MLVLVDPPENPEDEYLDITENKQGIAIATEIATIIRARIKEVTGLNASAGISYCKFLAKMASDLNKPNGQAVITPKMGPAFVADLTVKKFHGVGPATAEKMRRLGIVTGADLREKSLTFLRDNFGKSGGWYYRISRGIDERPVQPDRPRKSIGAEDTFAADIFDLGAAKAELIPLAGKVWRHAENKRISGRTVTLTVKYSDFQQITRSRTVGRNMRSADEIGEVAGAMLTELFPVQKGIRLLGVTLSSLGESSEWVGDAQMRLI